MRNKCVTYSYHWKKKWSHLDLKIWVTGGTKIKPGFRVIGEYLRVKFYYPIIRNLGSNFSSTSDSNYLVKMTPFFQCRQNFLFNSGKIREICFYFENNCTNLKQVFLNVLFMKFIKRFILRIIKRGFQKLQCKYCSYFLRIKALEIHTFPYHYLIFIRY